MWYIWNNRVLLINQEEWNYIICRKMDRTRDHHVEEGKPHPANFRTVFVVVWVLDDSYSNWGEMKS
jgi:hypothetical protein